MNFLLPLLAATTPDDVFKSMNQSMESDVNPSHVLAILAGLVALAVLVSVFKKRVERPAKPADVSSPGKLLKQVAREAGLSRREVKELKRLAETAGVTHPLTLLLCPSLMHAAIARRKGAAGRAR